MDPLPSSVSALFAQGRTLQANGRFAEALQCFDQALRLDPANVAVLASRALTLAYLRRVDDAVASSDKALKIEPMNVGVLYNRASLFIELKRFPEALQTLDNALKIQPRQLELLVFRGNVLQLLDRWDEALSTYNAAMVHHPHVAELAYGRGNVLRALGRYAEGLADYDSALKQHPSSPELLFNRGIVLVDLKRFTDAEAAFAQALQIRPNYLNALNGLGNVAYRLDRLPEALAYFDRVLALEPNLTEVHNGRGLTQHRMRAYDEALASFDRALALQPSHAEAWNNRGLTLKELGQVAAALESFNRALTINPTHVEALNGRGGVLETLRRIDEALADFNAALTLQPDHVHALYNRANLQWSKLRAAAPALADLKRVVQLQPDYPYAQGDLLHLKMFAADWSGIEEEKQRVDAAVQAGKRVIQPFVYQALSGSPAALQACAKIYAADRFPAADPVSRTAQRSGKLRVGYLCGEFREHTTSHLTVGLFESHDRNRFEVIAFDNGRDDASPMRRRLERAFDKLIPIASLGSRNAAQCVADHGIDILVNLNGYYGLSRMDVFALRPAPIQVNYLGFPGTLGAEYIDYIVADRSVIPADQEQYYTEKVVTLPGCYQVNDSKRTTPVLTTTRAAHGLPDGAFVFCNFSESYKLTPETFDSWMRILRAAPDSVLWQLQTSSTLFADNLRCEAKARGVDPARLIFAPFVAHQEHLQRVVLGDLFLDTLPCNAHSTASDVLWMGLPVLTCRGKSFAGRVAASLLDAVELPEFVTGDMRAYEVKAVELYRSPEYLCGIREKLVRNRTSGPLFDTAAFTRHLETAYIAMAGRLQRGEPAQAFSIDGLRP